MSLVEDLKGQFVVRDIAPYGSCIIVPGKQFDPDWEPALFDLGCSCVFTDMNGEAVTLVRLNKLHGEAKDERVVYEPQPKPEVEPAFVGVDLAKKQERTVEERVAIMKDPELRWSPEEETKLVNLWNHEPRFSALTISRQFPKRGFQAVLGRIAVLLKEGRIESRYRKKAGAKATLGPISPKVLKGKSGPKGSAWSEDEYKQVITLWGEGKDSKEIAASLPNRTLKAVKQCLERLKRAGRIKPRKSGRQLKQSSTGSGPGPMPPPSPSSVSETMEKDHKEISRGGPLPFTVTISVDVRVDCSNPASVEAFKKLLKELTA